jgi:hypothetical protein
MFPVITIAAEIHQAVRYGDLQQYRPPTAVTVCYEHFAGMPLETFNQAKTPSQAIASSHSVALDWMALGKEVLPNARSLSPEERSSINEFFLSHFQ